jgi:transposase-like protein
VSGRVVPYYCPYCGEEDLRPYEDDPDSDVEAGGAAAVRGRWHCADCTRVFAVKYHGMAAAPVYAAPPTRLPPPPDNEGDPRPQ